MIYMFGTKNADGSKDMVSVLGSKGAHLSEMSKLGIPVPIGFTISAKECNKFFNSGSKISADLKLEIKDGIAKIEEALGMSFGFSSKKKDPFLVSVRSGSVVSMPGMMDSVLNVGITDESFEFFAKKNGLRFALDIKKRFIESYGSVVLNINPIEFNEMERDYRIDNKIDKNETLKNEDLERIISIYNNKYNLLDQIKHTDPFDTLISCVEKVFLSWNSDRATFYRMANGIPHTLGTAVNIQMMVFGNLNKESCTGVAFSRDPSDGKNEIVGEYLIKAQGEDVVSGSKTPYPICDYNNKNSMCITMKERFNELLGISRKLERHYKFVQDIEFTIENNKLWILQTRDAKMSSNGLFKCLFDMQKEKIITKKEAILKIKTQDVSSVINKSIKISSNSKLICSGISASSGAAAGVIAFSCDASERLKSKGYNVILVRRDTSPKDIMGMMAADGFVTITGGSTCHAAVVARGMGKCCVVGCVNLSIDYEKKLLTSSDDKSIKIKEGEYVTVDGSNGKVYKGKLEIFEHEMEENFLRILSWAGEFANIKIRANVDNVEDLKVAEQFKFQGIGLCRTEHMFFKSERLNSLRKILFLDKSDYDYDSTIKEIFSFQKNDFTKFFKSLKGMPCNIRLLDPPIHEFIPKDEDLDNFIKNNNLNSSHIKEKLLSMSDINPMLGNRGVRLGITNEEIYKIQCQAIFASYCEAFKENKAKPAFLEIMIPFVISINEFDYIKSIIELEKERSSSEYGIPIECKIGTMLETPASCMTAGDFVSKCDFFSFGTNDLTQSCLAISRDDYYKFFKVYLEKGIFYNDPFVSLKRDSVGEMMRIAIDKIRSHPDYKNLNISICGEHATDYGSIDFLHNLNVDYISCSPYSIPAVTFVCAYHSIVKQIL